MIVFEKAPAKLNLSLDVISKRNDGYHNVEMVMTTIDLSDRVAIHELEENKIEISLESRYVPSDERNLAYKAARLFKDTYNIAKGIHIDIEKSIPVSAGLGGGSADAAAVLRGLNKLWSLHIPVQELAELGARIGSDIPFCVLGHTGVARGRGEMVNRLPAPPSCWVVLAKPDIGVSSGTIFEQINLKELIHPETAKVIDALHENDYPKLCHYIGNALEEVTCSVYPEVKRIKNKMVQAGAEGVLMSGSGPTVYGLVKHESKAQRIYNSMKGFCKEVYYVRLIG